ncbi:hypothetical protein [Staphylococcus gallinarum]|uniref:hypothetical protein n=1 Tax=Staphylococcus gallinarum TaxID=1293 RepID=UPI0030BF0DA8
MTLYELLGMKAKNSIFRSVIITDKKTFEGYPLVEVEPYDQTFLNAVLYPKRYEKTLDRIMKKVFNYFNNTDVWLSVYTEHGHIEFLLNEHYMREVYKLI